MQAEELGKAFRCMYPGGQGKVANSKSGNDDIFFIVYLLPISIFTIFFRVLLMARQSHLSGCFWLFTPKFWEMAGTYEW